ncbi:Stk1 family PASTA domain-containing Ser/Thr kinase [Alkalihalobacillus sp. MEB130]|uniref:Stk1 family PASTA domain-containing Ser/Thr kinase n=1 Tax=Alkalihalobacillus sp. MEB130 TaxID=2976704 RepID=UPI0028DFB2A9|nr:Stk1 family PASTA domain-containing Ser/Thr kinase [Alkalihalobacillus sp. MEB130]MDT8859075.1 Stk1 family PASTA domain-containing Ser/Thr kinase [Alkalihalobacillus sp. MEB130]
MIGQRISGRYQILETIGGGGMANVYKALDVILDRHVAVKVLQPQFSDDEQFIQRFRREAQSATSLAHPNIVNIYDVGEEGNTYYIVMEYVEGQTLKELIQSRGPISVEEATDYMEQMLAALEHSHANHIIHRDIKPHNILISKDGIVKVTDFGIARAISAATITHTNSVMGSVHYLSPEQARGGHVTYKSDIYSLGIVLYEMVTGELPFQGDTAVSIAIKHLQTDVPSAKEKIPTLPQSIENIIKKATVKDPLKRYPSVQEMEEDVATALSPERFNEKVFVLTSEDDEATKAIPIIRNDHQNADLDKTVEAPVKPMNQPVEQVNKNIEPQKPKKSKKSKGKKWFATLVILAFLILGGFVAAFALLPSIFQVGEVEVPNVLELPFDEAEEQLTALNLVVVREDEEHDDIPHNRVIRQSQTPGSIVKEGSSIRLFVSLGKEEIELEDVVGMRIERAENILRGLGFTVETSETETDEESEGIVLTQIPAEGTLVIPDETTVHLTYSVERMITLRDLVNERESDVINYLDEVGLTYNFSYEYSNTIESGRVLRQSPSANTELSKGEGVRLTVSQGREPAPEPEEEPVFNYEVNQEIHMSQEERDAGESFDVRIVFRDKTTDGQDKVYFEDTIDETKLFQIPLQTTPSQSGYIDIYINGQLEKNLGPYEYRRR